MEVNEDVARLIVMIQLITIYYVCVRVCACVLHSSEIGETMHCVIAIDVLVALFLLIILGS